MSISKRLYRSREDRIVAGIFGGLGQYFNIDPVLFRLVFIVVLIVTGLLPGLVIYFLAIFVMPLEPSDEGISSTKERDSQEEPVVYEMRAESVTNTKQESEKETPVEDANKW